MQIIGRNSDRLVGLVEEMLLLAEAEAGGLSLERPRVDLGLIVRWAAHRRLIVRSAARRRA